MKNFPKKSWIIAVFLLVASIAGVMLVHAQETTTSAAIPSSPANLPLLESYSDAQLEQVLNDLAAMPLIWPTNLPNHGIGGTYWSLAHPDWPPLPGTFGTPVWNLTPHSDSTMSADSADSGLAAPTGSGFYLLDDIDYPPIPDGDTNSGGGYLPAFSGGTPINTNLLWLQITNVAENTVYANLNHATDFVYQIFSLTNLSMATAVSNWNTETEVFPGMNTNVMPFTVSMNGRNPLFLWARDWTGITSNGNTVPQWWFWLWFTNINLSDGDLDSQDHTLLYDYEHGLDPDLLFSIEPANQTVTQGANASFSVTTEGAPLLSYQWYWNGAPLSDGNGVSGSASATLSLTGVQPSQAGNYYVVVANDSGSLISAYAVLAVVPLQTYDSPPLYLIPPYAYWNVTDISDPGQPVNIGELQEPFTEPSYVPGVSSAVPPVNTLWHTSPNVTVTEAYGTTSFGGVSNKGTVFKIGVNGPQGNQPNELSLSGNTLYGTTAGFGETNTYNNFGTIFSISTNGSKYTTIFGFNPAVSTANGQEGAEPEAGLALSGSALYGTTSGGGNGYGTVFSYTNGIFNNLHTFAGPANGDGTAPYAKLVLCGNMLYGTTEYGGVNSDGVGYGTVFEIDTNGDSSSYQVLHRFTGGSGDGAYPLGGLVLSGGVLYGTTSGGGTKSMGTVFSINLSDTNYSVLHDFGSSRDDGSEPEAGLVISGTTLYGTTEFGGTNFAGTVFSITGTNYTILHSFDENNTNDAAEPVAHLTLSGSTLYGTTASGGINDYGVVFSISTSGGEYTNLYSFQDGADGAYPETALVLAGNTLFGTTPGDPDSASVPNYGTIFSINTDGSDFTVLDTFTTNGFAVLHTFSGLDGANPSSQLALSGSTFYNIFTTVYGTTRNGGANGYGTVFKVNTDGTGFADLYDFGGTNDGKYPQTGLLISGNTLYGTTTNSIFKINTDGSDFICLTNINGASQLLLSPSGNTLYGTTYRGGVSDMGMLFSVSTEGTNLTDLYDFTGGTNGAFPNAGLELYGVENPIVNNGSNTYTLYGTTYSGGLHNYGMVFSVTNDGTGFNDLYDFTGASDGGNPAGGLLLTNNNLFGNTATYLYGITSSGGTNGGGTIFGMNLNGGSVQTIYNFSTNSQPEGKLAFLGSTLFGTTANGGAYTNGMVFSVNNNGSGFTDLYDFNGGSDGGTPLVGLTLPVVDNPNSIWSVDTTINVSAENVSNVTYSIAMDNFDVLYVNGTLASWTNHQGGSLWSSFLSMPNLHPGTNDVRVIIAGDDDQKDYFTMQIKSSLTNALFGTAFSGGSNSDGTIFEITPEGYETNLYRFSGSPDGQNPVGDLVLSGTNLYGVTQNGGIITQNGSGNGNGTIFKINTDGSGYKTLYEFTNVPDGANPLAGLILSGNTLYGTTSQGGSNSQYSTYGYGTIFSIHTDGSGYTNLYGFAGGNNGDGQNPQAPLLLIGTNLYGTTYYGGSSYNGTVFSIGTNGSGYTELYSFDGYPNDGSSPEGRLAVSGNTLYGTTYGGGTNTVSGAYGTIFSFTIGGIGDQILYSFTNTPDGAYPQGGLTLSGNTLYGTTYQGGDANNGTIFSIGIGGTGYTILQNFDSQFDTDFGQNPESDLLILGNLLYGTTYQGGAYSDGMVFSLSTNGTGFTDIYDFMGNQNSTQDGENPKGGICSP